jgi:hypothetical protein
MNIEDMSPSPHLPSRKAVRRARCSMAGLMALVVIAALDCAAIRSPLSGRPLTAILLLLGALPMANILAVALLPLIQRHRARLERRACLVGFEIVGWVALLLYAFCAVHHSDFLLDIVLRPLRPIRVQGRSAFLTVVCMALLTPQLAPALLGGWLCGRYHLRVRISDDGFSWAREQW